MFVICLLLACLDVAIIGAGVSGTYTAWQLRNQGLKVHLFEMTDRIGGRFYTYHFDDGIPEVNAELGAMYFIPQQHQRLNMVIHALQLNTREFHPQNPDRNIFYLRGVHLKSNQLNTTSIPYWLSKDEHKKYPEQLKRCVFFYYYSYNDLMYQLLDQYRLFQNQFRTTSWLFLFGFQFRISYKILQN